MKKYYFSPVGFGLFYQLGVLQTINNTNNNEKFKLYGSSGGAIICLLSLLKKEDRQIKNIIEITTKIRQNIFFNFFPFLNHFLHL
jgi:hypothetical protein